MASPISSGSGGGMRRSTLAALRGKTHAPSASANPYVKSVDQRPSMPSTASSRYGYQTTPQRDAPATSASVGSERGDLKGANGTISIRILYERIGRPACRLAA